MRFFVLLCLLTSAAFASPLSVKVRDVDLAHFPEVSVAFTVHAHTPLDVRHIDAESVGIIEEEVPIRALKVAPDGPQLSLALVLDDSGSQDHTLGHLKRAVNRLIDLFGPQDQAAVVSFARGTEVSAPLTTDKHALQDAVGRLKGYGATALYDGITLGIAEVYRAKGKRAVLVISDGVDQTYPGGHPLSEDTLPDAIHMAVAHNVEVHCIGVGHRVNHKVLERLARGTNGVYLHAPTDFELMNLLERIGFSFRGAFRVTYTSPKQAEDGTIRESRLTVNFQGFKGTDVYGYQVGDRTATDAVVVKRTQSYTPGTGDLQVFTTGLRDAPLSLRFYLFDQYNRPVRQGMTSPDGYGKLDGRDPELVKIKPGIYRLEIEVPGTTLRYVHAGVVIEGGQTRQLVYRYSKVVFRRNGTGWYDTQHPFGDTSELVSVKITNMADGRVCHAGRLVDFKEGRETSVYLEEGRYKFELGNVWHQSAGHEVEKVALKNAMEAEIGSGGGRILYFDVADSDLVIERDVLAAAKPPDLYRGRVNVNLDVTPDRPGERRSTTYRTEDEGQQGFAKEGVVVNMPPISQGIGGAPAALPGPLPGQGSQPDYLPGPVKSNGAPAPAPSAQPESGGSTELSQARQTPEPTGDRRIVKYRSEDRPAVAAAREIPPVRDVVPRPPPLSLAAKPQLEPLAALASITGNEPSRAMPEAAPLTERPLTPDGDEDRGQTARARRRGKKSDAGLSRLAQMAGEPDELAESRPETRDQMAARVLGEVARERIGGISHSDLEEQERLAFAEAAADAPVTKRSKKKSKAATPRAPKEKSELAIAAVRPVLPRAAPVTAVLPPPPSTPVELPAYEPVKPATPPSPAPAESLKARLAKLTATTADAGTKEKVESLARSLDSSRNGAAGPVGAVEPRSVAPATRGMEPDGIFGSQVVGTPPGQDDPSAKTVKGESTGSNRRPPSRAEPAPKRGKVFLGEDLKNEGGKKKIGPVAKSGQLAGEKSAGAWFPIGDPAISAFPTRSGAPPEKSATPAESPYIKILRKPASAQ